MICLKLIWFFYGLSRMFQLPQFVWALRSSVWDVFINFLLIGATDRSKISSDQKRFFIALSLYPLSFFANTPFKAKSFPHIATVYLVLTVYYHIMYLVPWYSENHFVLVLVSSWYYSRYRIPGIHLVGLTYILDIYQV